MIEPREQAAISVRDLTVGFGPKIVLDRLSLDVKRGEILGLVGASGGGKSVLLRTIIGLIPKREGRIEIMGMELDKAGLAEIQSIGRRWGILFQQGALFSSLTVRQNVQFPLRENLEISEPLLDELAVAKLEMVGLIPEDGDKFPSELSGGMTKRAALARALALDPEIVFLDEPTSGTRSHLCRGLRCVDRHAAADARPDSLHGHPRPRQSAHGVRPRCRARGWQGGGRGADRRPSALATPLGEILLPR